MDQSVILSSPGRLPAPDFWQGRRVLVTGHTGFKGSWLTMWLRSLGSSVAGVALPDLPSDPALWHELGISLTSETREDITSDAWQGSVADFEPELVVHLAAQPLVSGGYADPVRTFSTNVIGTAKVVDAALRLGSVRAVLVATTDKVYDTSATPPYTEMTPLHGRDPYAASKAAAELVVASWPRTAVPVVTARAGNVIGGGDWATDRLVPDLIRAWSAGAVPSLRQPDAVRPWQHVLEPLCGYLVYLEDLVAGADLPRALNFGPSTMQSVEVRVLAAHAAAAWGAARGEEPPGFTFLEQTRMQETHFLEIDSALALHRLRWRSALDWRGAVDLTIAWYAAHASGEPAHRLVDDQIRAFSGMVDR